MRKHFNNSSKAKWHSARIQRLLCCVAILLAATTAIIHIKYTEKYSVVLSVDTDTFTTEVNATTSSSVEATEIPNTSESRNIFIVIFSAPTNFEQRNAIRHSWLSERWRTKHLFNYTFLLGRRPDLAANETRKLKAESMKHKDLYIVDSLVDDYRNLTYKSIEMLKLVDSQFSSSSEVRYLVKVDDDTFLNMPLVNQAISKYQKEVGENGTFLAGAVSYKSQPKRNPDDKYYMPISMYSQSEYPPYVHGPIYILTIPSLKPMLKAAIKMPFIHLEDIYVALLAHAINLTLIDTDDFYISSVDDWCMMGPINSAHYITPKKMLQFWSEYLAVNDRNEPIPCQIALERLHKLRLILIIAFAAILMGFPPIVVFILKRDRHAFV